MINKTSFIVRIFWNEKRNKIQYELLEEVHFNDFGVDITVPIGFITDFASVPKLFWWLFDPVGKHNLADVIHDYLYTNVIGNRSKADYIFLRIMLDSNVSKIQAYIRYIYVRILGWYNWKMFKNKTL